ncbi:MAG: MFS transporter [Chloroflexota bacterium]
MDSRRLLPIFLIVFTDLLGAGVIAPILPIYTEGVFGATPLQITIFVALFYAAQSVAAPALGRISDRVGRRPVLIVSQIGTVFSLIIFIYAEPLGTAVNGLGFNFGLSGGLIVIYLARILDGITGGNFIIAQAYITDVSTEENRASSLGVLGAAFGLGFIFGPAFGGLLAPFGLTIPFIGAVLLTILSVFLTIIMLNESLPSEKRQLSKKHIPQAQLSHFFTSSSIILIISISFIITMALAILHSTFALFVDRMLFPNASPEIVGRNVGILLTFIGIFSVINQLFLIKPLVKQFGERKVIIFAGISLIIGFLGYSFTDSPVAIVLFSAPVSFGIGLSQPALQALITRFGTTQTQGQLLGFFQSSNNLAFIIGPIWAGFVFERYNPQVPFALMIPLMLIAVALSIWLIRHEIPNEHIELGISADI